MLISTTTTSQVSSDGEDSIRAGLHYLDHKNQRQIGEKLIVLSNKTIAMGSNGTIIYEGSYEGRAVAVKRLLQTHHDVALKEIQNLKNSDHHQNIVRYFGVEQDQDFVYLALERCTCNLDDLIHMCSADSSQYALVDEDDYYSTRDVSLYKEDRLESLKNVVGNVKLGKANGYPSFVLLKLMRDVVSGLVHLHELGIIHRDLKPQNVLISKERCFCAKLSDMGISKRLRENKSSLSCGTSGWQAPELLVRKGRQTRAMDLFSLGCILFFCITGGRHPFGDHLERDKNIVQNNMDLFLVKDIPEAHHIIYLLLAGDPGLRPKAIEVLHHPLFWDPEKRLSFLRVTSDKVGEDSDFLNALEDIKMFANWKRKVDAKIITHMEQVRQYKSGKVRDLLRLMRNMLNHYGELPVDIKELVGPLYEGFDGYFTSRFPRLLIEVYEVVRTRYCYKDKEYYKKYFES
ncbi:Serine/threonine protein kinase [Parasponia andersonii]|uniref:non-specific serine/threonine protein kinase n=1 Tax=Parasponia andersonii TaxID=3476 RepID=A0A2P5AU81_PARAD|nr:Serine/threonine protein kinase [Parasponia andersonii]